MRLPYASKWCYLCHAGPWAPYVGDSFSNQAQPGIDYHSTHLWVDNWDVAEANSTDDGSVAMSAPAADGSSFKFDRTWISTRNAVAAADGRPFVIEEFGPRRLLFRHVLRSILRWPLGYLAWCAALFDPPSKCANRHNGDPMLLALWPLHWLSMSRIHCSAACTRDFSYSINLSKQPWVLMRDCHGCRQVPAKAH